MSGVLVRKTWEEKGRVAVTQLQAKECQLSLGTVRSLAESRKESS